MATTVDYILKVQSSQAQKNLDATGKSALGASKNLLSAAGSMASVVTAAGVMASAVVNVAGALIDAAKAAVEFTQQSADLINDINDLSNRSAIATDTIKGLQFALQASGQDASQATQLLSRFPAVLAQAEVETSRTALGFKKLGVEVRNVDGTLRPANDVFLETLTRLQDIDDQTTRAKMAFDIFGRSSGQLLQALGQTDGLRQFVEFTEQFGVRTGPKASDAAADFQVVSAGLDTVLKGLKSTFVETFGPSITQLMIRFGSQLAFIQSLIINLSSTIELVFQAALNTVARIFDGLLSMLPKLARALLGMIPIFGNLGLTLFDLAGPIAQLTGLDQKFAATFGAFSKAINKANMDAASFEAQLQSLTAGGFTGFQTGGAGAPVAEGGGARDFSAVTGRMIKFLDKLDKTNQDLIFKTDELINSLVNLPMALEKAFRVGIAGIITDAVLQAVSGPAGFLNTLGEMFDKLTFGLSGIISKTIKSLARLGERDPKEIQEDFETFAAATGKGLEMLPRILIQVLPRFVVQLSVAIVKAILKLPFIIIDAVAELFIRAWQNIKEFFRSIFTKEGRQERREERKASGEPSELGKFFANLLTGSDFFMAGGIMSAQSGARFTGGKAGLAMLHQGETILPASGRAGQAEQRMMRQAGGGGGINIVINSAVVENRAIDELVRKLETRFGTFGVGKSSLFGR